MKFDFCIGNPPYQDNTLGDNKGFAPPVYDKFLEAAYEISDKVEMIHPARFLFNAGSTSKAWNEKMLNDEHLKVLEYEEDCTRVFSNTDIKGGIAITYHDNLADFGAIKVFTKYPALNGILTKVKVHKEFLGMNVISVSRTAYRLTDKFHEDFPNAKYKEGQDGKNIGRLSKGHDYDMSTNIFDRIPEVFKKEKPQNPNDYIRIMGREGNERVIKWIKKEYVNTPLPLYKYSIVLPKANNTGKFGEILSQPVVTDPGLGTTETFMSVGLFDTELECKNCLKYLSTKFARTLLGVLKTTQDLTPDKWQYVPIQDFTNHSKIKWESSVAEIDHQLYQKYNLTRQEIDFIETNVKEMV